MLVGGSRCPGRLRIIASCSPFCSVAPPRASTRLLPDGSQHPRRHGLCAPLRGGLGVPAACARGRALPTRAECRAAVRSCDVAQPRIIFLAWAAPAPAADAARGEPGEFGGVVLRCPLTMEDGSQCEAFFSSRPGLSAHMACMASGRFLTSCPQGTTLLGAALRCSCLTMSANTYRAPTPARSAAQNGERYADPPGWRQSEHGEERGGPARDGRHADRGFERPESQAAGGRSQRKAKCKQGARRASRARRALGVATAASTRVR